VTSETSSSRFTKIEKELAPRPAPSTVGRSCRHLRNLPGTGSAYHLEAASKAPAGAASLSPQEEPSLVQLYTYDSDATPPFSLLR
jgi:hypothetical protein